MVPKSDFFGVFLGIRQLLKAQGKPTTFGYSKEATLIYDMMAVELDDMR